MFCQFFPLYIIIVTQPSAKAQKPSANPSATKQLKDELKILAKLEHKNVVQLVGFCNNDGWFRRGRGLYVCNEFISNGALDKCIFGTSASPSLCWSCSSCIFRTHFGNYTVQSNIYICFAFMYICLFAH